MNAGLAEPGVGATAFLLVMGTLFMMAEKGVFTLDETHSVIDTALSILKSDGDTNKTLPEATAVSARALLENIRASLQKQ
jgi:hypothetical protein